MIKKAERLTAELKLRVPEALRARIEKAAKARFDGKGQSLNDEMLDRLERSFGRDKLEELLDLTYGPTTTAFLMETNRRGMLNIKDENIEEILAAVRGFLMRVQKGEAAR